MKINIPAAIYASTLIQIYAPGWFLCAPPWKSQILPGLWAIGLHRNKNPRKRYTLMLLRVGDAKKWLTQAEKAGDREFIKALLQNNL